MYKVENSSVEIFCNVKCN